MKAFCAFFCVVGLTLLGFSRQPKAASTGPTMLVITNDLQWAPTPGGPWQTVVSNVLIVWEVPGSNAFYRALLHSSTPIPTQ